MQLALIWLGTFLAVMMARATRLTPVVYYLGVEENAATFLRSIKQSWGIAFFGALAISLN